MPKIAANLRDQFPHPYTRRDAIEYLEFVRDQKPERSFALQYQVRRSAAWDFRLESTLRG